MKALLIKNLLILLFISSAYPCMATGYATIKGQVTDMNNNPVQFATAQLLSLKGNKLIQGKICNDKGEFSFAGIAAGKYKLTVSMLGYTRQTIENLVVDPTKEAVVQKKIQLTQGERTLHAIEISAQRKFIEQTVDKLIVNPDASVTSASENVYEILSKLPGVVVDNNDNISLKGKEGVKVMIDDKPTYLSAAQLASMLKGMQGKNVDRIEIIENPSARYDAEGNSGIINIKTKHNKAPGFNGSVNAGGRYSAKWGYNGGLDLNFNFGKINLYGNYARFAWAGNNSMDATRKFTTGTHAGAYQCIYNEVDYSGCGNNYKLGADYNISPKQVLSLMFRSNDGWNKEPENSATTFRSSTMLIDSSLITHSKSDNNWNNQTYNISYKWDIDSTGQQLTADVDYARFYYRNKNNQFGVYYGADGLDLNHNIDVATFQGNNIDIYTAKLDYNLPLSKKSSIEAGIKVSHVRNNSLIDMQGYLTQYDNFLYTENIQAGYVSLHSGFYKTSFQAGVRVENTLSEGNSQTTGTITHHRYCRFFPSLFVQRDLTKETNLNFSYSYRISRPSYHMLNPFRWMLDPYTYNVGNPNLQPQFTHSFSLGHNYKNKIISKAGYSYTSHLFTELIYQDDANKSIYQTNVNLSHSVDCNLSETFQFQPLAWWRYTSTFTGMYKQIHLPEGDMIDKWSFNGNLSNNFSLPYKYDLEIRAKYQSSMLISNIVLRNQYTIDLGVQHKIFNEKGVLKIALDDIFNTGCGSAFVRSQGVDIDVKNKWNSRRLNLTFSYRFGKDDFKNRSSRSTASSDEQDRSSK